jgi:hypothetical protein
MSSGRILAALLAMYAILAYATDHVSSETTKDIGIKTTQKTHERKSDEATPQQVVTGNQSSRSDLLRSSFS